MYLMVTVFPYQVTQGASVHKWSQMSHDLQGVACREWNILLRYMLTKITVTCIHYSDSILAAGISTVLLMVP